MTEFAIAASALLLLLFGILEFARALYVYHTISEAARLASRYAIVRGANCTVLDNCPDVTSSQIQTWLQSQVQLLDSTQLTATATWSTSTTPSNDCTTYSSTPSGNDTPGHLVCVTVAYPFNFALPFVSTPTLQITSASQMVIAN